jgi:hypothetical protein
MATENHTVDKPSRRRGLAAALTRWRTAPEPVVTGAGPYRLFNNIHPVREEQRFESVTEAMTAGGPGDPAEWFSITDPDKIYRLTPGSGAQKVIAAPGVRAELDTLQQQKRQRAEEARIAEERRQRQETVARTERWKKTVAAQRAAREAEEATKPKPVIDYLTAAGEALSDAGLRVEVTTQCGRTDTTDHDRTVASCKACGDTHTVQWNGTGWNYDRWARRQFDTDGKLSTPMACEWAKTHAAGCRAIPRPEGA